MNARIKHLVCRRKLHGVTFITGQTVKFGKKSWKTSSIVEDFRLNRIESMIMGKLLEKKKKKKEAS